MPKTASKAPRPTLPQTRKPTPPPGTPEHEQWLLDEADEESFPASDVSSTANPGSILAVKQLKNKAKRKR